MRMIVTGSIAYDYLMSFPGSFSDHLLPDQLSRVSLSFLVDTMEKRRGGCAPNIAYTLALLGERPQLMATAGQDFGDYRRWLESVGVDTSLVKEIDGKFTASFFCSTDAANNQIASFYTGAMAHAAELSFRALGAIDLVIISPNDPGAMKQHAEECRTMGVRFIFDPGQQCARMEGDELVAINMSVWESVEALADYVYRSEHVAFMRRRREWFEQFGKSYLALWWIPAGTIPTVREAMAQIAQLDRHGPTLAAFTFKHRFAPPHDGGAIVDSDERDECLT
jgi:sugar/nucleoside kinase (ribokinase family)